MRKFLSVCLEPANGRSAKTATKKRKRKALTGAKRVARQLGVGN